MPLSMQMSLHVIVRMPATGGFWSTRSLLMGRNIGWGSLLSSSGSTSWCLGSQRGNMAGRLVSHVILEAAASLEWPHVLAVAVVAHSV